MRKTSDSILAFTCFTHDQSDDEPTPSRVIFVLEPMYQGNIYFVRFESFNLAPLMDFISVRVYGLIIIINRASSINHKQ